MTYEENSEPFEIEKNMIGGSNQESFLNYMFSLSQKDKMELMNVVQYIGLAIIPIIVFVKLMKTYLPPFDNYKGNVELVLEVVLQLVVLFVFFWFVHRFIMFIPTYSKENYSTMNVFHFIVPFIFILFTLDTTISKKVNLLMNRALIYLGLEKENMQDVNSEEEIYTPPSIQVPCPEPMDNPHPQNTREETTGKMYRKNEPMLDQGPMAANEALGLSSF